ncbi:hypothetical protein N7461_002426 [Penicillium sp. DV-2018c]|nr:hypothetical protein N7461_002426 [Penicillium sp. DV-2018c]
MSRAQVKKSPGGGCVVMKSPGGGCVVMKSPGNLGCIGDHIPEAASCSIQKRSPGGGCVVMKSPGGGCVVMRFPERILNSTIPSSTMA